ncbi:MAG: chemotaxis protein CheA [Paracoccaceae bacterium]
MTPGSDIRETFFQECEELLETLADGLQEIDDAIRSGTPDSDTVNAVFRAVHSIKGGAGAFGLSDLVEFAHRFETAMDGMRSDKLIADEAAMRIFFRSSDRLHDLVTILREGSTPDPADSAPILAELDGLIGEPEDEEDDVEFVPMTLDLGGTTSPAGTTTYRIRFTPGETFYSSGNDPVHLIRALFDLGKPEVRLNADDVPGLDAIDVSSSYLSWEIDLETDEPEHEVLAIFEFAEGHCDLSIAPFDNEMACNDEPVSQPDVSDAPSNEQTKNPKNDASAAGKPRATVRVDLERVDRLINVVGELVINQAMLSQCVEAAGLDPGSDVAAGLDEFRLLSREMQESVMAIRAQPVKSLFQRMSRIVREAVAATGKSAQFLCKGEMTEVDKTVIERLADPLTHMLRNAVDHGLETPEERCAAGKTESGTVTLSAAHRSGRVIIEIADDGAGIDRLRVRQIAVDKGLIPPEADLSDNEIDNLLFMPGFSTASEVSNLSGRGVGMDVVKSAIQALNGRVSLTSIPGQGSTFSISLPLTLAVLEGMVVDVAGQTMVVPLTAIVETLRPATSDIHPLGKGGEVVSVRGEYLPIVDLGVSFGYRSNTGYTRDQVLLLVETDDKRNCALVVDAIHDQRQVVIKGLDDNYGQVPGVAAATVLGDGRIALIIDPDVIVTNTADLRSQPDGQQTTEGETNAAICRRSA